jgi:hypothetical protein
MRWGPFLALLWALAPPAAAQPPAPHDFLGHAVGADYKLARFERIHEYIRLLDDASDRLQVRELGTTTEGRPLIVVEIAAPDVMANLDRHRQDQALIADPRRIASPEEESRLVDSSKVVVLINCNLHSTEVAASQMALELAHDLATGDSPRINEILDRVIVLLVPSANPDGLDKVIDWYESSLGKPWEGSGMPWLYQRYAGHDNNRDWFMLALQETRLETRLLYREWFPTVVYDIHQMGNQGARLFVPPFHDPKNPNVHPLIDQTLMQIGGHMAEELAREGRKGVVWGAIFDNWWAGGFRTTPYRHNMVGILTEAASPLIASPVFQRKSDLRGSPRGMSEYALSTSFPDPWPGGWWRLRDVVDYEKTACMSLLTLASRYHAEFQGNYIRMGREAVELGRSSPPFAWLVPPAQRDPASAAHLLSVLHQTGIEVHEARTPFRADEVDYPSGTFILYCSQPYRAHLNDMMERQSYPDRSLYPGGPAEPPYDIAGWTLPLQMGVSHVAVSRPFDCDAVRLDAVPQPQGAVGGAASAEAWIVRPASNDDFRFLNRLHRIDAEVLVNGTGRTLALLSGARLPPGALVVTGGAPLRDKLPSILERTAVSPKGVEVLDPEARQLLSPVRPPRIGLYQPWTASMDEGWTRLVLENFEFDFATVHNAEVRAGRLRDRYDCLVLPSVSRSDLLDGRAPDSTAPQYVGGFGGVGTEALQAFVREGGTLVCIDDSCSFAISQFNLPIANLVAGKSSEEFYCPGSILRVTVDPTADVAYGMPENAWGYFTDSQAFEVQGGDADRPGVGKIESRVVVRYADTVLLASGWIRGASLIAGKPAIVEVDYGQGRIVLLGFRVQHRAQPHGTFRFLFNAVSGFRAPRE